MTQKDKVVDYVGSNPGKTAVQIAKATELKAANVSSILVDAGLFKREKPEGAKGWVYALAPKTAG